MGITIEQYRAKVGSHAIFLKQKEIANCFKHEFWNTMMLCYMYMLYFSKKKPLHLQYSRKSETVHWFKATFHYHHVYVPLLIRLCNDVETNPGPTLYDIIDATTTVCADFSQGGRRFGPTAGKQCVAMSLTAIVHSQIENVSTWNHS